MASAAVLRCNLVVLFCVKILNSYLTSSAEISDTSDSKNTQCSIISSVSQKVLVHNTNI